MRWVLYSAALVLAVLLGAAILYHESLYVAIYDHRPAWLYNAADLGGVGAMIVAAAVAIAALASKLGK